MCSNKTLFIKTSGDSRLVPSYPGLDYLSGHVFLKCCIIFVQLKASYS